MLDFLFNSSAWQLIVQSDLMTKFILLCLFSLSVICIAIIFYKYNSFKREKKQVYLLLQEIKNSNTFQDLVIISRKYEKSLGGRFFKHNLNELRLFLKNKDEGFEKNNIKLTIKDLEFLELSIAQSVDQLLIEQETLLPILGTSAAVSPLIGLLGTIWGLIHAFVSISREKSADIAVIAPGIAEALTTTLAGLIVAIPALVAFNYFSNELRKLEQQMDILADRFFRIIKQTFE